MDLPHNASAPAAQAVPLTTEPYRTCAPRHNGQQCMAAPHVGVGHTPSPPLTPPLSRSLCLAARRPNATVAGADTPPTPPPRLRCSLCPDLPLLALVVVPACLVSLPALERLYEARAARREREGAAAGSGGGKDALGKKEVGGVASETKPAAATPRIPATP